jgi:hypothetical protein
VVLLEWNNVKGMTRDNPDDYNKTKDVYNWKEDGRDVKFVLQFLRGEGRIKRQNIIVYIMIDIVYDLHCL